MKTLLPDLESVLHEQAYQESGGIDELFALHGMTPADIAEAARTVVARKAARESVTI